MNSNEAKYVKELAEQARRHFFCHRRRNNKDFFHLRYWKGDEWVHEMMEEVIKDWPINDPWRVQFAHDALDVILLSDDPSDPRIEWDYYEENLIDWLASDFGRMYFMDEALDRLCVDCQLNKTKRSKPTGYLLGEGQILEKKQIYKIILDYLRAFNEKQRRTSISTRNETQ